MAKPFRAAYHLSRHAAKKVSPLTLIERASAKRQIAQFMASGGFVYFGYVSHLNDDHHLIRGATASRQQQDGHYSVGTLNGYDISFVQRTLPQLRATAGAARNDPHRFLVIDIDLHRQVDLPHVFVGAQDMGHAFYKRLFMTFPYFRQYQAMATNEAMNRHYSLYTSSRNYMFAKSMLPDDLLRQFDHTYAPLSFEVTSGHVYVYGISHVPSKKFLNKILGAAIWLAEQIDAADRQSLD